MHHSQYTEYTVEMMSNNTKPKPPAFDLNKPTTAFLLVIICCAVAFPLIITVYSLLRPKLGRIFAPRLLLLEGWLCPIGKLPSSFFAWISPAYMLSDDDFFNHMGMDALVYMRFLRLCIKLTLFTIPFGLILLLPLNLHGGHKLSDPLDRMSTSNIKKGSPKLWAHWVCVWIYTAAAMYLLYEEWKVYIQYKQTYLSKGKGKQYVTLLYDLHPEKMTDESLKLYVEKLFPGKVSGTYLVKDLFKWDKLIKAHDKLIRKLENAKANSELVATESHMLVETRDGQVFKYEKKLQILQVRLREEQMSTPMPTRSAIVVFNSLSSRYLSVNTPLDLEVFHNRTQPAPDASEVFWNNLAISPFKRKLRYSVGEGLLLLSILLWSPAVAVISSLKNLKALAKQWKYLARIIDPMPSFLIALLQGVVPVLLIVILQRIIQWMYYKLSRFQGLFSKSQIEKKVFRDLILFEVFNTFFVFVVSSSIFGVMYNILSVIESPSGIPFLLATSLPSQANFYINYTALQTFVAHGVELIRLFELVWYSIKIKWFAKTRRTKLEAWEPGPPKYADWFTTGLLVFMVGMSYSVLSPLIVPFVVLYFGFAYVIWAYQMLYVYIPEYDLGGELWPMVFSRLILGMVVFQMLMTGTLMLRGMFFAGGFLIPLIMLTLAFWYWMRKYFQLLGDKLSLAATLDVKAPENSFLEGVKESYIRNNVIPGVFDASTDVKRQSFEYENYMPPTANIDYELEGYSTR